MSETYGEYEDPTLVSEYEDGVLAGDDGSLQESWGNEDSQLGDFYNQEGAQDSEVAQFDSTLTGDAPDYSTAEQDYSDAADSYGTAADEYGTAADDYSSAADDFSGDGY